MTTFREAIETGNIDVVGGMLAEDVVFVSPVAYRPYSGKAITVALLRAVVEVFDDFHYTGELEGDHAHAYVFHAKVDGLDITGCDFLTYGPDGQIAEFMVMVRPLRAAEALAARMGERFEAIKAAANAD